MTMQTATRTKATTKNGHAMNGKHVRPVGVDKRAVNEIAKSMRTLREARATASIDKFPEGVGIVVGQLRMVSRNLSKLADAIERGPAQ